MAIIGHVMLNFAHSVGTFHEVISEGLIDRAEYLFDTVGTACLIVTNGVYIF